jgi:hypothetical protein
VQTGPRAQEQICESIFIQCSAQVSDLAVPRDGRSPGFLCVTASPETNPSELAARKRSTILCHLRHAASLKLNPNEANERPGRIPVPDNDPGMARPRLKRLQPTAHCRLPIDQIVVKRRFVLGIRPGPIPGNALRSQLATCRIGFVFPILSRECEAPAEPSSRSRPPSRISAQVSPISIHSAAAKPKWQVGSFRSSCHAAAPRVCFRNSPRVHF